MEIAPDTLRAALAALTEAQAYVLHPSSVTPSATKRVATHCIPNASFQALASQLRNASKALTEALQDA